MNESQVFASAVKLAAPADRTAYLDRACGGDTRLRAAVEALIRAHTDDPDFLEQPIGSLGELVDPPPENGAMPGPETAGLLVDGRFKLLEQIGEGGMGTVWMAEQTKPVQRLVAVKLVRAGMDSRHVVARFGAERQALALMDHPNIARVLDAGAAEDGRPFFVMELVKGVPITQYCDDHRLTPRQRLELFVPVCHAVQHAHQKGVIHRDLKPSNVLVARYDDRPVPKVIDFGVAKAVGRPLTDQTVHTGFGAVVGTVEYMSPEQATFNQLDIDTRSDIYSLGVLLYELLAGSPPFSKGEWGEGGVLEMLDAIREREPTRPSTKLSTAVGLPTLAANRGTEPGKLARLVRGELDWVVMKALEKDRNRRYETASALAVDLTRYLADEPVLACKPSAAYRLRRFARRNRSGLAVAGLVLFFLVLLGSMAGWAWRDRVARAAERANHLDQAIERAELLHREGKRGEALAALERTRLLAREAEPASAVAQRIDSLQQRLDAEGRDEVFVAQFEAIRREVQTEVDVEKSVFDQEKGYPRLRAALEQYGITIGVTPPAAAVSHIQQRPPAIQTVVVVALDECLRFVPREDSATRQWLFDVLLAADSDPWRNQVRRAWTQPETLEALVRGIDVRQQPPSFLVLVVMGVPIKSPSRWNLAPERAVRLSRRLLGESSTRKGLSMAREALGGDSLLHGGAGPAPRQPRCTGQPRPSSAVGGGIGGSRRRSSAGRGSRAAVCPRPPRPRLCHSVCRGSWTKPPSIRGGHSPPAGQRRGHHALGCFLRDTKRDYAGAIDCFHKAIELDPKNVQFRLELALALRLHGKPDDALTLRKALELNPNSVHVHNVHSDGPCPRQQGKLDDAIDSYRKALELDPKNARHHCELGYALGLQGKLDEANRKSTRTAIRVQPDNAYPTMPSRVSSVTSSTTTLAAIDCFNKALRTRPEQRLHPLRLRPCAASAWEAGRGRCGIPRGPPPEAGHRRRPR